MPDVVRIVPYDPRWREFFELERARVGAVGGEWVEVVEHVGSTSVPGLDAKPVVDLMVGVRSLREGRCCARLLEGLGYEDRGEAGVPGRIFLRTASPRTFHLNLAVVGGEFWEQHLLFRDCLRAHPETAHEYARLKHDLAGRFRHDREAYTRAKTSFVEGVLGRARVGRRS